MNKRFLLLLFILTGFYAQLYSQHYSLGYTYGYSWNEVKNNGDVPGSSQNNFITGLSSEWITKKNLRLGAEILYEKRGFDLEYIVFFNNFSQKHIKNYHHQKYLSIPLKIGYQTGKRIYAFGDIGIVPAFNVKSTFTYPNTDSLFNILGEITEREQINIKTFDLGGLLDFGAGYNLTDKFSVSGSIRLQHSLFDFSEVYRMSHRATTLFFTLRYKLQ